MNVSQFNRMFLVVLASVSVLGIPACMLSPHDKQRVEARNSIVEFSGFFHQPEAEILIQALNPQSRAWEMIGNTRSTSVSYRTADGMDFYYFRNDLPIPGKYWERGITGHRAQVRTTSGGIYLMSVEEDWWPCYMQGNGTGDFLRNCASEKNPVARIYTNDYTGLDCPGITEQDRELIRLVNDYREQNGLHRIALSPSLCLVAKAHIVDLIENRPDKVSGCNPHSWSDKGPWSPCCYSSTNFQCSNNKPRELTDYPGEGYENFHSGYPGEPPSSVLRSWKSSPGHNAVILNQGKWSDARFFHWRAVGAAIHGGYAALWFGSAVDPLIE